MKRREKAAHIITAIVRGCHKYSKGDIKDSYLLLKEIPETNPSISNANRAVHSN